jgi:hypothetical protein
MAPRALSSCVRVDSRMSPVSASPASRRPEKWATNRPATTANATTPATVPTRRGHDRGGRAAATRAWCASIARIVRAARAV